MIIGRSYWLKKLKSGFTSNTSFSGWDSAKRIGIVLPEMTPEQFKPIKTVMEEWKSEGKRVSVLKLSQLRMNKKRESIRERDVLYANETTWKGIPESPDFNEFIHTEYDAVLQFCIGSGGVLDFVPYMVKAGIVVGPSSSEGEPYNLQITVDGRSWTDVLQESEHWLKKINYVS